MKKQILTTASALAFMAGMAGMAQAQSVGDWTLGFGVHVLTPTDNSNWTSVGRVDADSSVRPTITGEFFVMDNVGVELIGAYPFKHDINLKGAGEIGHVKVLPPVLSLQYHFTNASSFTPFVGAGVNYTHFYGESTKGAINGSRLKLSDTWGWALHAGLDYDLTERSALRADVRYIDVRTKTKLNGSRIGKVKINPFVYGAAYILKF